MAKRKRHTPNAENTLRSRSAPRNPYVSHPLMRKGGVHEKPKKAQRASARRETKQLVRDWQSAFHQLISILQ